MFQVKVTVVGFLGDVDTYPCHFKHRLWDEFVFDGECYHGRLCPSVWAQIAPKVTALHAAGPRYVEWASYYPFWYCPLTVADPAAEKYDGVGYRNVLHDVVPPPHDMARLIPPGACSWPPAEEQTLARDPVVVCPDSRTSVVFALEAFDLSEKGFDTAYFRRQMAILVKLRRHGATPAEGVLDLFTTRETLDIYPALGSVAVRMLTEELELLGYVVTEGGLTSITAKGEAKLESFVGGLPPEHRAAFAEYSA